MFLFKGLFSFFTILAMSFLISSCGTGVLYEEAGSGDEDVPGSEDVSEDFNLRIASSGIYKIACYSPPESSKSYEHYMEFQEGDVNNGSFIQTSKHYSSDSKCESLSTEVVYNASVNFGAASGEKDQEFSKMLVLPEPYGDGSLVDAPKMNVTMANTMMTVYDESLIADVQAEYPDAEVELGVPFLAEEGVVDYYAHVYFPDDFSYITSPAFMPDFTDYDVRATFETARNVVQAVKQ